MIPNPPSVPGSTTSEVAAESIKPMACRLRLGVLRAISWGDRGLTDEEAQLFTGLPGNCERPRRRECSVLGWVRDSGKTRATASGRQAVVWVVTNEGRKVLDEAYGTKTSK